MHVWMGVSVCFFRISLRVYNTQNALSSCASFSHVFSFSWSKFTPNWYRSLSPTTARPRHSARRRSLEDSKRELDSEVHKLNKFVQQLRSSKCWLDQREKKVSEFEILLAADSSGLGSSQEQLPSRVTTSGEQTSSPESSNSGGSTRSNASQFRSLEAMQQVGIRWDASLILKSSTRLRFSLTSCLNPPKRT